MSNTALKVDKRSKEELKKNASRRLRTEGFIPAVVYGLAQKPLEIKINSKDFKDTIKGKSLSNLILDMHVKVDGKDKKETTLIKDMQKNPINADILHIDFIRIQMKTEVEATVPVFIFLMKKFQRVLKKKMEFFSMGSGKFILCACLQIFLMCWNMI
jgi:large subunit ribosomal protein L25